jgi:hypothetical protein
VGIEVQSLRMLLLVRQMGVSLKNVLTIGRQDLLVTGPQIQQVFDSFGEPVSPEEAAMLALGRDRFSEPVIERLGGTNVGSMDASTYEGATVIHDLNDPVPESLEAKYSLVIDGGTLEHVFDFPRAIRTCMSLPEVGGHLLMMNPANNSMGHGFYQFSPDLFYRVFTPANGYRVKAMFLVSPFSDHEWLYVRDPAAVRSRIGYNDSREVWYIFVIAERTAIVPMFTEWPHQSDYAAEWSGKPQKGDDGGRLAFFDAAATVKPNSARQKIRGFLPSKARLAWRTWQTGRAAERAPDSAHFIPFMPGVDDLAALLARADRL